ncbi:alkaline-phosphatase-like protein [Spinellus fusiger]|nr:alkaline-phosphatase-like protein [Spinellus fusiger]
MTILLLVGVASALVLPKTSEQVEYNNGTHIYKPTVILISLDGVVNQDLYMSMTPQLDQIAKDGVKARWMTPSFPPITFPNHWTLVTGLYPESHGIVGNYFYDPVLNDTFNYKSPANSWDSKWWGGEPIWITAEKQNTKTGVIMWPGCSSRLEDRTPTYQIPYSDDMTFDAKVDQALQWIDLPIDQRPQFIGLYFPSIDQAGHLYGPYANEANTSIGHLLTGLEQRNLTDIVHVIVVSDHGMSDTDKSRLIYYDDVLTEEEIALMWRVEAYPSMAIRPNPFANQTQVVQTLYDAFIRLKLHLEKNGGDAHFEVYKQEDIPERYHFRHHTRIAPLLVLPDPGWNLVTHKVFNSTVDTVYHPRGVHGYDNLSPESRAIFVAKGPLFKHGLLKPFWNVEVYQVLTRILNLTPAANNGSLYGHLELEE